MIHVCLCFHDKTGHYAKFAGTTMLSLLENTDSEVTVHILHDNTLTPDNHDKFIYLAGRYNQQVRFHNVEKLCADKLKEYMKLFPAMKSSRITVAGFYKLLIPQLLSEYTDKIIYLDADIIVNLDIKNLWKVDIEGVPLAAVTEISNKVSMHDFVICNDGIIKTEDYFNSGVLSMNLKILRSEEETILKAIKFRNENPQYDQFDQLIFNYCFATKALKLPNRFNQFVPTAGSFVERKIYHYVSSYIRLNVNNPFNRLWIDHFIKTPWFDTNAIGNMYNFILKLGENQLIQMRKLSTACSGKARVFVVTAERLERIKKDFLIRDDEEVIVAEKDVMTQELVDKIKAERDKKVFFGFISGFPEALKKAGLIENENFFNGFLFSHETWKDSSLAYGYKIIKEM